MSTKSKDLDMYSLKQITLCFGSIFADPIFIRVESIQPGLDDIVEEIKTTMKNCGWDKSKTEKNMPSEKEEGTAAN